MKPETPTKANAAPMSIMVVDDHPLMRAGVAAVIDLRPGMFVVAQAGSSREAIALFDQHHPDVTLMDLRLAEGSGVETIRRIRARHPAARFIVLTTYEGDEDIHQALEAGAQGYIIKGMPNETLVAALQSVHAGRRFIPPPVARALESRTPDSRLSTREKEVLLHLVHGRSNREIAAKLFISEATVKCHLGVIFMRMGVSDRTQAVVAALQRGLVHL